MNRAFILRRSESLLRMKPTGFRQQSYGQRKVKGKVKKPFKLNLADDTNATYE